MEDALNADPGGRPSSQCVKQAEAAQIGAGRAIELAFCDCRPHLINLYQGLGFRPYRHTYNHPHFGLMVPSCSSPATQTTCGRSVRRCSAR